MRWRSQAAAGWKQEASVQLPAGPYSLAVVLVLLHRQAPHLRQRPAVVTQRAEGSRPNNTAHRTWPDAAPQRHAGSTDGRRRQLGAATQCIVVAMYMYAHVARARAGARARALTAYATALHRQ